MAWRIGSGNHATGYLIRVGDYLFQSPLSFYTRRNRWDVAPGYERNPRPDFNRPILSECLFCHAGRARLVPDTLNRYEREPFTAEAITCERCHGPSDAHLHTPGRGSIVNPGRLAPPLRDAVCEQCHLGGEARIRNPGRDWSDFTPGQPLERSFSVYVAPGRFKVVSHVEQLALSRCAQQSNGRLWCGTCHDPHGKPADTAGHYRGRCLTCHDNHSGPAADCVSCHMKARRAPDSGHAAFTDHWIQRRPSGELPERPRNFALTAWREPDEAIAGRNLGLAYLSAGERDSSPWHLQEAFRILSGVMARFPDDPDLLAGLGVILFLKDQPGDAALLLERAVARRPRYGPYYHRLAMAWKATGNTGRARRILERAIEFDPSLEIAYHALADMQTGVERRRTIERYLQFVPQSLIAREALK